MPVVDRGVVLQAGVGAGPGGIADLLPQRARLYGVGDLAGLGAPEQIPVGVGDKLYVIGGRVGSAFISGTSNNVDLVEMYDGAANLWLPRTRMLLVSIAAGISAASAAIAAAIAVYLAFRGIR